MSPDVVVVGGGVMGAWAALQLRLTGRTVLLLDAYGFGHPRASSGDDTRILRSSHGDDAFYARWAREARAVWEAFGQEQRVELFVQAGTLWFARRESGFEADSEATLRGLDIPVEHLSTDEVVHRWPGIRVDDLAWALFEPEGGLLLARRGVETVARAARRAGVDLRIAAVRPPEPRAEGRLESISLLDGSRITAEAFVFACGPWLPALFPDTIGDRIRVTKQSVHYLGPAPGDGRWMAPRFPTWVDYETTFYGIGAVATTGVKVATDSYGPPFDPAGSAGPGRRSRRPCRRSVTTAASGSRTWPRRPSSRRASASTRRPKTRISSSTAIRHSTTCGSWVAGQATGSSTGR